jgi:spermidine synthase
MSYVADLVAEPGVGLAVVHLGAGALTLARYLAATRPGSRQRAVEVSEEVAATVREQLPLGRGVKVPVQVADARAAVSRLRAGSADLVALDVFAGARTPAHLTSREMLAEVQRVLAPGGVGPAGDVPVGLPARGGGGRARGLARAAVRQRGARSLRGRLAGGWPDPSLRR